MEIINHLPSAGVGSASRISVSEDAFHLLLLLRQGGQGGHIFIGIVILLDLDLVVQRVGGLWSWELHCLMLLSCVFLSCASCDKN